MPRLRTRLSLCPGSFWLWITLGALGAAASHGQPVILDFEDIVDPSVETGFGFVLPSRQYADRGVTITGGPPVAFARPAGSDFAHSGRKFLVPCSGEFCTAPLSLEFTAAQRNVAVWVGEKLGNPRPATAVLRVFDRNGAELRNVLVHLPASSSSEVPIRLPLSIQLDEARIHRATVSVLPSCSSCESLAIDDIEFDAAGPPPACEASRSPEVTLDSPADGSPTAQLNRFLLASTVTSDAPLQALRVVATTSAGLNARNLLGPVTVGPGRVVFGPTWIHDLLLPGDNVVGVEAQNCFGIGSAGTTVQHQPVAPGTRVEVLRFEVTQAVQGEKDTVPLIAGKRTLVRVYARLEGAAAALENVTAFLGGCTYTGFFCIRDFPLLRSQKAIRLEATADLAAQRLALDASFNFELPEEWIRGEPIHVELSRLEVDGERLALPCDGCQNPSPRIPTTGRTYLFDSAKPVEVLLLPLLYWDGPHPIFPRGTDLDHLRSWLARAYPTSKVDAPAVPLILPTGRHFGSARQVNALLVTMQLALWGEDLFLPDFLPRLDKRLLKPRFYAIVSDEGGFMPGEEVNFTVEIPILDDIVVHVASGPTGIPSEGYGWDTDASYGDWYGGHEIAHMYGRQHAACGATDHLDDDYPFPEGHLSGPPSSNPRYSGVYVGIDVGDPGLGIPPKVYPPSGHDVMSYCADEWLSPYTYDALLDKLLRRNTGAAPRALAARSWVTTAEDALVVVGLIDSAAETVRLESVLRLPDRPLTTRPGSSPWRIELHGAGGEVLAAYPFEPHTSTDSAEEEQSPSALVAEVVPYRAETHRIVVLHDGQELAAREVSAHAPEVDILFPNGGEQLASGPSVLRWQASDADGDELSYSVLYSIDGGQHFQLVSMGLEEPQLGIDLSLLPGGARAVLRVVASDGANAGTDDSDAPFFVAPKPPQPRIITPATGTHLAAGATLVAIGEAYDLEDGLLEPPRLEWSSDRQGVVGQGRSVATSSLAPGRHHLTLTATDNQQLKATSRVDVFVDPLPGGAPVVYNLCLQDEATGDYLWVNSGTGDYRFTHCGEAGFTVSGHGEVRAPVTTLPCRLKLVDLSGSDKPYPQSVEAAFQRCGGASRASVSFHPGDAFLLEDRATERTGCTCGSGP